MSQTEIKPLRHKFLYCKICGRRRRHRSTLFIWGGVLTVLTLGLFLPVWLLAHLFFPHWKCPGCGNKRWGIKTAHNPF